MIRHTAATLGTIGQIGVTVDDLDTAVAFYRDKVGLPHLFSAPPSMAFFGCGDVRLMLSKPEAGSADRYRGAIYFKVPDIEARHRELTARGVAFKQEPRLIARMPDHELWMAFFEDPDRNLLALMCEKR